MGWKTVALCRKNSAKVRWTDIEVVERMVVPKKHLRVRLERGSGAIHCRR